MRTLRTLIAEEDPGHPGLLQEALMETFRRKVSGLAPGTAECRLQLLLEQSHEMLGNTQREHLTSHSVQVSGVAVRIGQALGMDEPSLNRLRFAGLCHDLGKVAIPDEILAKPAALSPEERLLVARHAADGAEISRLLGADRETCACVHFHHHRFDGNGQMEESAVPLGARVLNVADAFVTMTSERGYQRPRSKSGALRELQKESGAQFDPHVVQAALKSFSGRVDGLLTGAAH